MSELPNDVGYIKLDLFEGGVVSQFATALSYMFDSGKTKLILDLRDNGGGRVNILTQIASYLIYNEGKATSLVMKTEERSGSDNYYTVANNFDTRLQKLIVLANNNTASASECLIGALLCYGDNFDKNGNDLVIEKNSQGIAKTYGKGIMQTTYLLLNGGAFKLTTGRVLWPDGRCIHGVGVIATGDNAVEKGFAVQRAIQIVNSN
jgi:carboxyl-terminal processing protease